MMFVHPVTFFKRVGGGTPAAFTGSRDFDGTDDYVVVSTTTGFPVGEVARSFSFWMKQHTRTNGVNSMVVGLNRANNEGFYIQMATIAGVTYLFSDGQNAANNITISGAEIPSLDAWHHIVFTSDGTNWEYYLNGTSTKSGAFGAQLLVNVSALEIGRRSQGATGYFNGQVQDVRHFDIELNSTHVTDLYTNKSNSTAAAADMVGHWPLSEGAESLEDQTANGNDATNNGSTTTSDGPEDI